MDALLRLKRPERVARLRGKDVADIMPADEKRKKAEAVVPTAPTPAAEGAPEAGPASDSTSGEAPAVAPQA